MSDNVELDIDELFGFYVSEDNNVCTLTIDDNCMTEYDIQADEIIEYLHEKNIHGIKEDNIKKAVDDFYNSNTHITNLVVAEGKAPTVGKDGYIKLYFEIPKNFEDIFNDTKNDSIDYKDIDKYIVAKKGQILIERIPPETGDDGIDVFGQIIPGIRGKIDKTDIVARKNILVSHGRKTFSSAIDGQVVFTQHANRKITISVLPELKIDGNVDYSIGHISFNGNVVITGSVLDGFNVTALGNINIGGAINSSNVHATGNINVMKGILGRGKGNIKCEGNLFTKFVENANITVNGDFYCERSIINSTVIVGGNILCRGSIIGGQISSNNNMKVMNIGSDVGTKTNIIVGRDMLIYQMLRQLKDSIQKYETQISITDTEKTLVDEQLEQLKNQYSVLEEKYFNFNLDANLKIINCIHPDVTLAIGDQTIVFTRKKCDIKYYDGQILAKWKKQQDSK